MPLKQRWAALQKESRISAALGLHLLCVACSVPEMCVASRRAQGRIAPSELAMDLPDAFGLFSEYAKSLEFHERPDYQMLFGLFGAACGRRGRVVVDRPGRDSCQAILVARRVEVCQSRVSRVALPRPAFRQKNKSADVCVDVGVVQVRSGRCMLGPPNWEAAEPQQRKGPAE